MRTLWFAVPMMLVSAVARSADAGVTIYDPNPEHLWNRLYAAIAMRTEDGTSYGADIAEPIRKPFDDPGKLAQLLDEFLSNQGENRATGVLRRALFQNDIWAAFDLAAPSKNAAISARLARVLERLTLAPTEIAQLPDTYAQAVKSGEFASDFDAEHPHRAFLPPDLFDPHGPWVQIGRKVRPIAPFHVNLLSGRSTFDVFIRCPGGRDATLEYLERLNRYRMPFWPGTAQFAPGTPEFPAGTIVALVRRMMVITNRLEPASTRITQSIQFRVYRKVAPSDITHFDEQQRPFELVMRRADVLAGDDGGLHVMGSDEAEYQIFPGRPTGLRGPVVLSTCAGCHGQFGGIRSVNTYTGFPSSSNLDLRLPPATDPRDEDAFTMEWKMGRFDWGVLHGLLEADQTTGPN